MSKEDLLNQAAAEIEKLREAVQTLTFENQCLSSMAKEGEAYRKHFVGYWLTMKMVLGDVLNNEEAIRTATNAAKCFPMSYLLHEVGILEKRLREALLKRRIKNAKEYNWGRLTGFF